jgi:hypothetical protein
MKMKRTNNGTWLKLAALLPVLGGGFLGACEDEMEMTPPAPTAGSGGGTTPGTGGTGGSTTPAAEVAVNEDITSDATWDKPVYLLKKKIYVTGNAKLTIAPGTRILGDAAAAASDKAALIVSRGSQLIAKGTKDKPIVFTSSSPAGSRKGGDWAGLALLGSARLNTGDPCASGAAGCLESGLEGIPASELKAKFGGVDDASSCGELQYVRIEFAGAELEPTRELNSLTFAGCGEGTKASYLQAHRGTDDGIEVFGGKVGFDHVVLSGNEDDSLDWDFGWTGKVQFLVIHQRAGAGDNGIEASGSPKMVTAEPRSAPVLYNVTMVGRPDGGSGSSSRPSSAVHFKEGTRGTLRNFIIQGFKLDVIDVDTSKDPNLDPNMEWPMFLSVENSLFWMNGSYGAEPTGTAPADDDKGFDEKAKVEEEPRKNQIVVAPMITSVPGLTAAEEKPNYVPKSVDVSGQAMPPAPMDASATFAGAFAPNATSSWTDGWTDYPVN